MADTTDHVDVEAGRPRAAARAKSRPICPQMPPRVWKGCIGLVGVACLATLITVLASITDLGPSDQILVKDPAGHWVRQGPFQGVIFTTYPKEMRQGTLLQPHQYAVVKNQLSGEPRDIDGPKLLFLGPYDKLLKVSQKVVLQDNEYAIVKHSLTGVIRHEEGPTLFHPGVFDTVLRTRSKIVLQKDEYIRMVDGVTGAERVVHGPVNFVPIPLETSINGTKQDLFLNIDLSALLLNRNTGEQRLVVEKGAFAPGPYEEILEVRPLIYVLPHEALVVRNERGQLTVHAGTDAQDGLGVSFFLPPYSEIFTMMWSDYSSLPADSSSRVLVEKIDVRARKIFYEYEVRTRDNVKMTLEGTIFWQVTNVSKLVLSTADPEGDVWQHARSVLIEAVSNATLSDFMTGFNAIVMDAFRRQAQDGFYLDRGVELQSMEVTRFDCADPATSSILQEIIQETTNRINRLTAQQSENDVKAAALTADILLERQRTELITIKAENERLQAQMAGEATGMQLMKGAATFIGGLNESLPSIASRVELYKLHEELQSRNKDTYNLASGSAHLFLTPSDLNLRLDTRTTKNGTLEL
eukprot:CAMPEP_0115096764 /NCGR_PEP_ID=MMETSP0227-20121206/29963_1 /TAXON_ID=89957 /ORGANISM="Polarella glacialis, Strain CCMP 1383" /LENGTH=581 /DNA_ID=CAMNT_0002490651 /DNA_START=55 /DNA_END=1800 /DNA_ORIENTATION=-